MKYKSDILQLMKGRSLRKFIYLSIAAALATIFLKFLAWYLTGSVGLFSDALESCVNLAAAIIALILLNLAETPADEKHPYGHTKAEYFSSAIEGGIGLLITVGASLINLVVALVLIKNGKKYNSITLEADGKHLMTDVYTSGGVLAGILLVKLSGWQVLDGIVAVGVALNILWAGYQLIHRSATGLLDASLPEPDLKKIVETLDLLKSQEIEHHSLLTRQAGQRKFIAFHLLLPGDWSIQKGHDEAEKIEKNIRKLFTEPVTVFTHLEPREDPVSMQDIGIDRHDT